MPVFCPSGAGIPGVTKIQRPYHDFIIITLKGSSEPLRHRG
jgi:hypothetical protein